jgi:magnesium chelatase subunit D
MERISVREEDLKTAVTLVLLPRASVRLQQPAAAETEMEPRPHEEEPSQQRQDQLPEDLVIQALDCKLPEELLKLASGNGSAGVRRRHANGRPTPNSGRGRFVRAVADSPDNRSIALEATLRAAAPYQQYRQDSRQRALQVTARDLRYKQFTQKAGMLFIFAVDASGSMALNRMNQAKGALIKLLQQAYLHRDKVALISFRSDRAEVLLPPTRSVELARRVLDALPAGGGTPLAAGIDAALTLARRAQYSGVRQAMLVLFTDGLVNVGRGDSPRKAIWEELSETCAAFRLGGWPSVVIDTRSHLLSGGEAKRLAQMLDAKYVYLQQPDGRTVHEAVAAYADTVRKGLNSRPI